MTINDIIRCVFDVYKKCEVTTFPVDCFDIISKYGFKIQLYSELTETKRKACLRLSNDACTVEDTIYYNKSNTLERIRFSTMHELGHILLVTGDEDEADSFASTILAPPQIIIRSGCETADAIHSMFGLSYAAANRALYNSKSWAFKQRTEIDYQIRDWFYPVEKEEPKKIRTKKSRSRLSRYEKEVKERIEFFEQNDPDYFFRAAECQWLYGSDL